VCVCVRVCVRFTLTVPAALVEGKVSFVGASQLISTARVSLTRSHTHVLTHTHTHQVPLCIEDFNRVGGRVPLLANLSPHGPYHMSDLDSLGGVPVVMKELLEGGLLHGHCLTVTGAWEIPCGCAALAGTGRRGGFWGVCSAATSATTTPHA
jgi:dihydroxyacid dehydratase/phosphogluconate dehydratase